VLGIWLNSELSLGLTAQSDKEEADTMSDNSFIGFGLVPKQSGRTGAIQLRNPLGSGVNVFAEAISAWRASGTNLIIMRHALPFIDQGVQNNKHLGGQTPKAEVRTEKIFGTLPGSLFFINSSPKNNTIELLAGIGIDRPIVMPPGTGLYVATDKKKVETGVVWHWSELGI